mmetsp:Transcript_25109/g.73559  ORF Transcript_25109/g.73559 Transcript_25109/m.73559 type:complete len:299 (-) Transcript_25109:172-1068(-)
MSPLARDGRGEGRPLEELGPHERGGGGTPPVVSGIGIGIVGLLGGNGPHDGGALGQFRRHRQLEKSGQASSVSLTRARPPGAQSVHQSSQGVRGVLQRHVIVAIVIVAVVPLPGGGEQVGQYAVGRDVPFPRRIGGEGIERVQERHRRLRLRLIAVVVRRLLLLLLVFGGVGNVHCIVVLLLLLRLVDLRFLLVLLVVVVGHDHVTDLVLLVGNFISLLILNPDLGLRCRCGRRRLGRRNLLLRTLPLGRRRRRRRRRLLRLLARLPLVLPHDDGGRSRSGGPLRSHLLKGYVLPLIY